MGQLTRMEIDVIHNGYLVEVIFDGGECVQIYMQDLNELEAVVNTAAGSVQK